MQNTPADIYTSTQVGFTLAEGFLNNCITGDARVFYETGIEASLNQYGVDSDFDSYITNSAVAYDPARAREQIGTQNGLLFSLTVMRPGQNGGELRFLFWFRLLMLETREEKYPDVMRIALPKGI